MKNNYLISLAMLILSSMTVQASALNSSIMKCAEIQDSVARLACFDYLAAQELKPSTVAGVNKTAIKTVPAAPKTVAFGAEHLKQPKVAEEEQQVVFTVDKLTKDPYGKWRFSFDNGQKWKQTDSTYLNIKIGDSVLLKKGFMNAVYLKKNEPNSSKKIRVKRQQ